MEDPEGMDLLVDGTEAAITRPAAGDEAGEGRAESCVLSHFGRSTVGCLLKMELFAKPWCT